MATEIFTPIGPGFYASSDDLRKVQRLLNFVPPHLGGPFPTDPVKVDGVFTPKFWTAVNTFQAKHPQCSGELQKMAPDGPTYAKLYSFDPDPPLSMTSTMMCPHGGMVTVASTGKPNLSDNTLSPQAICVVNGCPSHPQPCIKVTWMDSGRFLDRRSIGLCVSASEVPQGPVVIARA